MAMLTAFIPQGYSADVKREFIKALGDVECLGFDMARKYEHVYVHEFDASHSDANMQKCKYLIVYTGAGKSLEAKREVVKLFKEKCDEIFGEGDSLLSVKFEEHTNNLISVDGIMRCEDPVAVAEQAAYQAK